MNNEEKSLPQEEDKIQNVEPKPEVSKKMPLGVIIGIAAGAVAIIVAIVLIILLSGNKCPGHVDANDDYLCDNCGEHFDDGDEVKPSENNGVEVTFTVLLDNGQPLSGVKFTLTRGDKTYSFISGADGTVKQSIIPATYALSYDAETLPEYCWIDIPGVKIENSTTSVTITVIDNKPDGSLNKPFPANDESSEITVAPGEELYFSCRGQSLRYVSIKSDSLVVNYNGETYSAIDGEIKVPVSSVDVETPTIFSVKNISTESVTATMEIYAPLGSYDNPHKLTSTTATAEVVTETSVYYVYTAEKDGVFVISSPTSGNDILITRNIVNDEGEIVSTITAESSEDSKGYIYVTNGDEIKIAISYVAPKSDDSTKPVADKGNETQTESHTVEFSFNIYGATNEDPVPVYNNDILIRLDAGKTLVFCSEEGKTVSVDGNSSLIVMNNDSSISVGEATSLADGAKLTVTNSTDALVMFVITIK